jgi:copper chaperone
MSKQRVTIKVDGMTCGHCTATVERLIKESDGIYEVTVSLNDGSADVLLDPFKTDKEKLKTSINENSTYKAS